MFERYIRGHLKGLYRWSPEARDIKRFFYTWDDEGLIDASGSICIPRNLMMFVPLLGKVTILDIGFCIEVFPAHVDWRPLVMLPEERIIGQELARVTVTAAGGQSG